MEINSRVGLYAAASAPKLPSNVKIGKDGKVKVKPVWGAAGSGKSKKAKKAPPPPKVKFVNKTPAGEKKDLSGEIDSGYQPEAVEAAWDSWWEKKGYYTCDAKEALKAKPEDRFVMVLPPPNVTGTLHIGHALMLSIEDMVVRWNRMCGKHVLWLPGVDHAGIATQSVVERQLWNASKQTRFDLGREAFLAKIWDWKEEKGNTILSQFRRMGTSMDHSRSVFTMDEKRTKAVTAAFVKMYEKGYIFRSTRLVNWSHALNTAISDIEVDSVDVSGATMFNVPGHDPKKKYEFGVITSFAYKVVDSEEEIVVATTRIETLFGDTAVVVHPEDPRYKHLHGKKVQHMFLDRQIPIITDPLAADMEKGTGAVKITPAHDKNDYETGKRNNLPMISILNDDGSLNEHCGEFAGMMRYDARVAVEEKLAEMGLFRGKKDNEMQLPLCSRSKDVIEYRLKPQWYVKCDELGKRSIAKVESGELKLVPDTHNIHWQRWLEDAHDWCISRQLWWGHRIPAYLVGIKGQPKPNSNDGTNWVVGATEEDALKQAVERLGVKAEEIELHQDEDVLDTWFSSGLFPFSVFGWPDEDGKNEELDAFFPGALLETGHDILFFWVARMVMMSLALHDKLPFDTVYLHAMVRDRVGRKMSKSLGNVIDPVAVIAGCTLPKLIEAITKSNLPAKEVKKAIKNQEAEFPNGIAECGSDALRLGLVGYTVQGRSINLDIGRVEANRKFCNKLWNVSKFLLMNLGADFAPVPNFATTVSKDQLAVRDRWMLSRLAQTIKEVDAAYVGYAFGEVTMAIQKFWLDYLCDVYVEAIKPVLKGTDAHAKSMALNTLWLCLDSGLKLLHPTMPFVTEELWQRLPNKPASEPESIMVAAYPRPAVFDRLADAEADATYELAMSVGKSARSIAANYKVSGKQPVYLFTSSTEKTEQLKSTTIDIETLGNVTVTELRVIGSSETPTGCAVTVLSEDLHVHMFLQGKINTAKEIKRLMNEVTKLEKSISTIESRCSSERYLSSAPEHVQAEDKQKISSMVEKRDMCLQEVEKFRAFE